MEAILTDIAFALTRAALATFLARELYTVTIPSLLVFSITAYTVVSRDPVRRSLPPHIGIRGIWRVFNGGITNDSRGLVRLSIFGRDVFWIARGGILREVFGSSAQMIPLLQTSKGMVSLKASDRIALKQVLSASNIARYQKVVDIEVVRFIEKLTTSPTPRVPKIEEFVSRILHRLLYETMPPVNQPSTNVRARHDVQRSLSIYFFPFLSKFLNDSDSISSRLGSTTENTGGNQSKNVPSLQRELQRNTSDPAAIMEYIISNAGPLLISALDCSFRGLSTNQSIIQEAQNELNGKNVSIDNLPIIKAIVAESLRLGALIAALDDWYKLTDDLWYKRWILPRNSIVIIDRKGTSKDPIKLSNTNFLPESLAGSDDVDMMVFGYSNTVKPLVEMILSTTITKIFQNFNVVTQDSTEKDINS